MKFLEKYYGEPLFWVAMLLGNVSGFITSIIWGGGWLLVAMACALAAVACASRLSDTIG